MSPIANSFRHVPLCKILYFYFKYYWNVLLKQNGILTDTAECKSRYEVFKSYKSSLVKRIWERERTINAGHNYFKLTSQAAFFALVLKW
jgi:hypothetical protein